MAHSLGGTVARRRSANTATRRSRSVRSRSTGCSSGAVGGRRPSDPRRAVCRRPAGDPGVGEPRRSGRRGAGRLRGRGDQRERADRGDGGPDRGAVRDAVSSRGRAHRQRPRDPAQLRLPGLRLHGRLDDGVVCRRGDGEDSRTGRRRAGGVRAQRRRRFDGRGADPAPRDRRSADVHLRRQRRPAAGRGGADPEAVRATAAAADVRRRLDDVPGSARRRHRPGTEAEDHRRDVHRRVRGRGGEARRRRLSRPGHAVSRRHRIGRRSSASRR